MFTLDEITKKDSGKFKYVIFNVDNQYYIAIGDSAHAKIAQDFFKGRGKDLGLVDLCLQAADLGIIGGGVLDWNKGSDQIIYHAGSSFGPNGSDPEQEGKVRIALKEIMVETKIFYKDPLDIVTTKKKRVIVLP